MDDSLQRLPDAEARAEKIVQQADLEQFEARRDAPRGTINTDTVRDRPVRGGESR